MVSKVPDLEAIAWQGWSVTLVRIQESNADLVDRIQFGWLPLHVDSHVILSVLSNRISVLLYGNYLKPSKFISNAFDFITCTLKITV